MIREINGRVISRFEINVAHVTRYHGAPTRENKNGASRIIFRGGSAYNLFARKNGLRFPRSLFVLVFEIAY